MIYTGSIWYITNRLQYPIFPLHLYESHIRDPCYVQDKQLRGLGFIPVSALEVGIRVGFNGNAASDANGLEGLISGSFTLNLRGRHGVGVFRKTMSRSGSYGSESRTKEHRICLRGGSGGCLPEKLDLLVHTQS